MLIQQILNIVAYVNIHTYVVYIHAFYFVIYINK